MIRPSRRSRTLHVAVLVVGLSALFADAMSAQPSSVSRTPAPVALSSPALGQIRCLAIQHNGRVKPFDSFARETLETITGQPRVDHQDPTATVLSIIADPDRWQEVLLVSIPFGPLRESLGLDRKTTHVSYHQLVASRKLMRLLPPIVEKQQREEKLTIAEEETMDAFQRFVALSGLLEQKLPLVPPPPTALRSERTWRQINEPTGYSTQQQDELRTAWSEFRSALNTEPAGMVQQRTGRLLQQLQVANPAAFPSRWRLDLEVSYNRVAPFHLAWILYLLSAAWLLASLRRPRPWLARAAMFLFGSAALIHVGGIVCRVVIGGRPPVSNFFETMLWLPLVAVAVSLILERVYQARYISLAAAIVAAMALCLAEHVPLDSSITPVVAVLRSNTWLTIHVLTIVASYGALALATTLAHVYASLYLTHRRHAALPALGLFLYRTIQVGVVLLAGGIMLGAVWANASWGRYWGWDPKETWALITLLWFLAVLHGRFAGWIHGVGVALATIGGFFLLLMTYYGVSFYLVGLHSYAGGHAKPLPTLLIGYLIAEVGFLCLVGIVAMTPRVARSGPRQRTA